MNRLTLMFRYGDEARADIALTEDKIYYRFATVDSIEDGELPAPGTLFTSLAYNVIEALKAKPGEDALDGQTKVEAFVDNRKLPDDFSLQSIKRCVDILADEADEFEFIRGFC